jgi:hypothetical protein
MRPMSENYWRLTKKFGHMRIRRLFQRIVLASRPLRMEKLAEFLAFKSEAGEDLTFEERWRSENQKIRCFLRVPA